MTRYLISFDDGAMNHIPDEDWPAVGEASHAVVREAQDAGVWIFGGGVERQQSKVVAADGAVTAGPDPETKAVIGGFSIIDVPSHQEALVWAAKIAVGCRCAQEVRAIMFDPLRCACRCDGRLAGRPLRRRRRRPTRVKAAPGAGTADREQSGDRVEVTGRGLRSPAPPGRRRAAARSASGLHRCGAI